VTAAARPNRPAPWAAIEPRAPRRRTLSREAIIEVALGIVDSDGLDALSMRRISQELNTGPASLYAHVGSKEELLELLLDRVSADLPRPVPEPERWREQVKTFLTQARDNLIAHNDLSRIALVSNIPTLPNQLDSAETLLALLQAGGLPDQVVAYGVDMLALYLVASAYELSQRHGPEGASPEQDESYLDGIRSYFASLPADRYPVLISMIVPMTRAVGDERWEFGLDVMLGGLELAAQAERRSSEAR
jgi:AcrR family transcriptional regulator